MGFLHLGAEVFETYGPSSESSGRTRLDSCGGQLGPLSPYSTVNGVRVGYLTQMKLTKTT